VRAGMEVEQRARREKELVNSPIVLLSGIHQNESSGWMKLDTTTT